jgi:hypothetical protein
VLDSAWGPDERVMDELANLSVSSEESSGLSLGSAARATHTERSESDGLLHMLLSKIEALESELRGRAVPTPDIPAAEAKSGASAAGAGGHVICVDTNMPSVSEGWGACVALVSRRGGVPSGAAVSCAGTAVCMPVAAVEPEPSPDRRATAAIAELRADMDPPMLVRCDVRRRIVFSARWHGGVPTHWQLPKLPRRTRTALLLGCFVSICFGLLAIGVVAIRGVEARLWLHS